MTFSSLLNIDVPPTKIKNVETFVERIIQETFLEAFYEFYMIKKKESGAINFSYETTEDDEVVTLRRKINQNGNLERKSDSKTVNSSQNCVHKNTQKVCMVLTRHNNDNIHKRKITYCL